MDPMVLLALVASSLLAAAVGAAVAVVAARRVAPAPPPAVSAPGVDHAVAALGAELERLRGAVGELRRDGADQHGRLSAGLDQAVRATAGLAATTARLQEALANSRARGQWGERLVDDVLRAAGMVEGVSYVRQRTLEGGGRPDVTFLLPDERLLHLDVKFPLDNYLRVLDAAEDGERAGATARFLRDVRDRVRELAGRDYTDPATTVGFVLLFIPNEAVYGFLHEHDPGLADEALGRQVVLCSPFTLFAVLGVVRQAVDTFRLARTGDEILACLAGVTHQWDALSGSIDKLGRQLGTLAKTYDELAGTRRRQLQRQLDRIEALQVAPPTGPPLSGSPVAAGELDGGPDTGARAATAAAALAGEPRPGAERRSVVLPPCPAST